MLIMQSTCWYIVLPIKKRFEQVMNTLAEASNNKLIYRTYAEIENALFSMMNFLM